MPRCHQICVEHGKKIVPEPSAFTTPSRRSLRAQRRGPAVLFALLLAALPLAAAAAPPALSLPLACTPNKDCWIANHVDLDPGPGLRDYACGVLTYDQHKGTDFAIRDRAAMEAGVVVLAAAATGSPT